MMEQVGWSELPAAVRAAVVALGIVQVAVEVAALVVLAKTPAERVRLSKKWPWVLIILFVNLVGAIVFLAAGRLPAPASGEAGSQGAAGETMARAVDVLYGREEERRGE